MINLSNIQCVGCTACASICTKSVIEMQKNDEGFLYPCIKNQDDCIDCKLCETVCPVYNYKQEEEVEQYGLIAQITDELIRKESASGGMFSAIALSILDEGGIVYGAAYNDNFEVCHVGISSKDDLWRLRNSKYVQSNLVGVFKEVKAYLLDNRQVCFSGTPCQIEGLQHYLGRDYENLLLVDVVCHGVSSPLIWEKYLETMKKYNPKNIYFRWKHYGYKYSTMSIFNTTNQEIYYAGVESDKMLRAYFTNNCARETCYDCVFKKRYRISDFTIWDYFQPGIFNKEFDDDKGTTGVLVHSRKGQHRLKKICDAGLIRFQEVLPNDLVFGNNEMVASVKKGSCRESLLKDANRMSGEQLFNKYFPETWKTKTKKTVRLMLVRLGIYRALKRTVNMYRRNKVRK